MSILILLSTVSSEGNVVEVEEVATPCWDESLPMSMITNTVTSVTSQITNSLGRDSVSNSSEERALNGTLKAQLGNYTRNCDIIVAESSKKQSKQENKFFLHEAAERINSVCVFTRDSSAVLPSWIKDFVRSEKEGNASIIHESNDIIQVKISKQLLILL